MTTAEQAIPKTAQNHAIEGELDAILAQLSYDQIRFLIARAESASDTEACRAVHIPRGTMTHWPAEQRELLKQALLLMAQDGIVTALHIRRRNLAKAMAVKVAGLDSADEKIRQSVSTEVIEWEMGKATQKNVNEDTGERVIRLKWDANDNDNAPPAP